MLAPGDKFNDYEVIEAVGHDNLVARYIARRRTSPKFSSLVMLLVVHRSLNDDKAMIRLVLERARTLAAVVHPSVVRIEDIGRHAGIHYLATEYVHGVSLTELVGRLSERRLKPHRKLCVWLAAQIAEALAAIHDARSMNGNPLDAMHGELRPCNVLISHTGHVKLIHFGEADELARQSSAGMLGKLRYHAPEQLEGEHCDRRTDIYAVGVMIWELLTGRRFLWSLRTGTGQERASHDRLGPPGRYSARSTPAIDLVVLRAVAWAAVDRHDDALQFRSALLRAEPLSMRIDSPEVAAFVRSLFADDLERKRANWPSELTDAVEPTTAVTSSQRWSLDDLTTNFIDIPARDPGGLCALGTQPVAPLDRDDQPHGSALAPPVRAQADAQPAPDSNGWFDDAAPNTQAGMMTVNLPIDGPLTPSSSEPKPDPPRASGQAPPPPPPAAFRARRPAIELRAVQNRKAHGAVPQVTVPLSAGWLTPTGSRRMMCSACAVLGILLSPSPLRELGSRSEAGGVPAPTGSTCPSGRDAGVGPGRTECDLPDRSSLMCTL